MLKGSYSMLERLKIYERLRPKHFSNTTQDIKANTPLHRSDSGGRLL